MAWHGIDLGQRDHVTQGSPTSLCALRQFGEGIALGLMGQAYAQMGQNDKAIGYYKQALAIDREKRSAEQSGL